MGQISAPKTFTIGRVAKGAAVNIQTVRYYERIGILKPVARLDSGYRLYNDSAIRTLKFIKHAQELGFSLEEIQELLNLKAEKKSKCKEVQGKAEAQIEAVEEKIRNLERIRNALSELVQKCRERKTGAECPILDCLDECSPQGKE